MGHEFTGEVHSIGEGIKNLKVGDKVVSPFTISCGKCFFCKKDRTSRCVHSKVFGSVLLEGELRMSQERVNEEFHSDRKDKVKRGADEKCPSPNDFFNFHESGAQAQYVKVPLADSTLYKLDGLGNSLPEETLLLMADIFPTGECLDSRCFHSSGTRLSSYQSSSFPLSALITHQVIS